MGCQKNIAKEIIEADADYVLSLKGNHETDIGFIILLQLPQILQSLF